MNLKFLYVQTSEQRPLKQTTCHADSIAGAQPTGRQDGDWEFPTISVASEDLELRELVEPIRTEPLWQSQPHGGLWTLNCNRLRSDCRVMILTGLYTGLRLGDVATLTWANLDWQQQELIVTTQKSGSRCW